LSVSYYGVCDFADVILGAGSVDVFRQGLDDETAKVGRSRSFTSDDLVGPDHEVQPMTVLPFGVVDDVKGQLRVG
jgi:hypothetical protein